jgi:hypothetical protein
MITSPRSLASSKGGIEEALSDEGTLTSKFPILAAGWDLGIGGSLGVG